MEGVSMKVTDGMRQMRASGMTDERMATLCGCTPATIKRAFNPPRPKPMPPPTKEETRKRKRLQESKELFYAANMLWACSRQIKRRAKERGKKFQSEAVRRRMLRAVNRAALSLDAAAGKIRMEAILTGWA